MPQMKPMIWIMLMTTTLFMMLSTIIMNYFTTTETINQIKQKKIKSMKWKW